MTGHSLGPHRPVTTSERAHWAAVAVQQAVERASMAPHDRALQLAVEARKAEYDAVCEAEARAAQMQPYVALGRRVALRRGR